MRYELQRSSPEGWMFVAEADSIPGLTWAVVSNVCTYRVVDHVTGVAGEMRCNGKVPCNFRAAKL